MKNKYARNILGKCCKAKSFAKASKGAIYEVQKRDLVKWHNNANAGNVNLI